MAGRGLANHVAARAGQQGLGVPAVIEPMSAEAAHATGTAYTREHTKAWATTIAAYDGFVFVSPEYNHSTSGVLKNAIDFLYDEWTDKAAALVSYGSAGGARAIEHRRGVLSELQVAHVQQSLSFSAFTDFDNFRSPEAKLIPTDIQQHFAVTMFDQLETWTTALRQVRTGKQAAATRA